MPDISALMTPLQIGNITVPNRILMAPLTRNRALADGTPTELAAVYYGQRASAGLIISEATQINPLGKGYIDTPGIYKKEHVKAWKKITDTVHAAGGRIFCQLWHVGRISHVDVLPKGEQPVAPSAIRAKAKTFIESGFADVSEPRALKLDEIPALIKDYAHAAQCAKDAGFDGVEVHAANGYLLNQFLNDSANHRDDQYGGSIENRTRLLLEVVEAVKSVWDSGSIGVRTSPFGTQNDIDDSDRMALYSHVFKELCKHDLAYMHAIDALPQEGEKPDAAAKRTKELRAFWKGIYIANGGYDGEKAAKAIADGVDAVTFGKLFISNPDLPIRILTGTKFNDWDQPTFYGGGAKGYTDYPYCEAFEVKVAGK